MRREEDPMAHPWVLRTYEEKESSFQKQLSVVTDSSSKLKDMLTPIQSIILILRFQTFRKPSTFQCCMLLNVRNVSLGSILRFFATN